MINFFSNGCVPCVVEMPDLEDAHQAYGDQVAFLGLSYAETVEDGPELVERTGVTYEHRAGPGRRHPHRLRRRSGCPTTVFIDADGTITTTHTGRIHPDELQDELDGAAGVIDAPLALAFTRRHGGHGEPLRLRHAARLPDLLPRAWRAGRPTRTPGPAWPGPWPSAPP